MKVSKIFRGDRTIWVVFLLLTIVSLVEVYSSIGLFAYSQTGGGSPSGLFFKHFFIVLATWVVVILASQINYRFFSRFALLGYWVSIVLLGVMLMMGGRWFHIPVVGQFQPSEVPKVVLVIFVARQLALKKDRVADLGTFLSLLIYIVFVVVLVLPENFSTAALIFLSCYLMMLFGGVNRKWWWRLMLAGLLAVVVGLGVAYVRYDKSLNAQEEVRTEQLLERSSTWGHRIHSWLKPNPDELSQENMARMAIVRGGLFGVGPGNTVHARLMTQAHNDFIYAIIIEELGMVTGVLLLLLYSFFYFKCIRLAWRCKGRFGALVVSGFGTMIYLQALANMGVAVGVLPVTGQTLPFVSYGGTAYLFLGCGLGVIQSVAASVSDSERNEKAAAEAVVPSDEPGVEVSDETVETSENEN